MGGRVRALHLELDALRRLFPVALVPHELLHERLLAHERLLQALAQCVDHRLRLVLHGFHVESLERLGAEVEASLHLVDEGRVVEVLAVDAVHLTRGEGGEVQGGREWVAAEAHVAAKAGIFRQRRHHGAPRGAHHAGGVHVHVHAHVIHAHAHVHVHVDRRGRDRSRDGHGRLRGSVLRDWRDGHPRAGGPARGRGTGRGGAESVRAGGILLEGHGEGLSHHALALDHVETRAERVEVGDAGDPPRGVRSRHRRITVLTVELTARAPLRVGECAVAGVEIGTERAREALLLRRTGIGRHPLLGARGALHPRRSGTVRARADGPVRRVLLVLHRIARRGWSPRRANRTGASGANGRTLSCVSLCAMGGLRPALPEPSSRS